MLSRSVTSNVPVRFKSRTISIAVIGAPDALESLRNSQHDVVRTNRSLTRWYMTLEVFLAEQRAHIRSGHNWERIKIYILVS